VIGINSQIATGEGGQGAVGIGFAIPVNTAREFIPRLKHDGKVEIADLGATGVAATGSKHGAVIHSAPDGGPAAEAGLNAGDVILSVAGIKVSSMGDVLQIVEAHLPGQTLAIRARRQGHVRTFAVKLGSRTVSTPQ